MFVFPKSQALRFPTTICSLPIDVMVNEKSFRDFLMPVGTKQYPLSVGTPQRESIAAFMGHPSQVARGNVKDPDIRFVQMHLHRYLPAIG